MPRRSTRKRKASSSAGHGQGASKQQGGKSPPAAIPVRQTSLLATVLTPDTLGRSLSFLDVSSLVRSEMTAKFVKNAAVGVWTALDKKVGADEKVAGDTARDRVIRSSPQYRHYLLAKYAAKVEMLKPTDTETIQYNLSAQLAEGLDFYIRFAKLDLKGNFAQYEGSKRKGGTKFLAGGVFKPRKGDMNGMIGFDLTGCDIGDWPLLGTFLRPKGYSFRNRVMFDDENHYDKRINALSGVIATVVAINRKTLETSVVFAPDSHYCIDGMRYEEEGNEGYGHTQGTMTPFEWEYPDEVEDEADYPVRFGEYTFYEGSWEFTISASE